jgi:hypothetical protein
VVPHKLAGHVLRGQLIEQRGDMVGACLLSTPCAGHGWPVP